MPKNKTDNFLKAIKRYAKEEKNALQGEVKQLKSERLKEAEENAKRDSQRQIKEKLMETRNRLTARLAKQTQDGQRRLYVERSGMVEEVFRLASEQLMEYTRTPGYAEKLRDSAKAVAEVFGGNDCVIFVSERDLGAADSLRSFFSGSAEIRADKAIAIGGVRGYCESMGIIADETLDSKLEAQREWFIENATLSVV